MKRSEELRKAILNVQAIQFARLCSAQESSKNPVVNIDNEASEALGILIKLAEDSLNTRSETKIDAETINSMFWGKATMVISKAGDKWVISKKDWNEIVEKITSATADIMED